MAEHRMSGREMPIGWLLAVLAMVVIVISVAVGILATSLLDGGIGTMGL